jgi:hypothetical protein
MTIEKQIDKMVVDFASDLRELVRRAVLDQVEAALAEVTDLKGRARAVAGRGRAVGRGGKRSPKEIEATTKKLLGHIEQNPNQRMEQISSALGIRTTLLQPCIKQLVADKRIKTRGKARGTTYIAA